MPSMTLAKSAGIASHSLVHSLLRDAHPKVFNGFHQHQHRRESVRGASLRMDVQVTMKCLQ
jgi:hypothetical protein